MRLPDVLAADERSKRWWSAWRKLDFSWTSSDTLGEAGEEGDEDAKQRLQRYWRTDPASGVLRSDAELLDAGELERDPRGRLWHLVHVPSRWDDGSPTWKADAGDPKWQRFWRIVRARLEAASVDILAGAANDTMPAPALLSGVVFGATPPDWSWGEGLCELNAVFQTCAFLGPASFLGVASASGLDLRHCLFGAIADFDGVAVAGDLRFDGATFLSHLRMARAAIAGDLRFERCDLHGELSLIEARVEGRLRCHSAVFHGPAGFEDSTVGGEAYVAWCRFLDVASFAGVRFRDRCFLLKNVFAADASFAGRCYGDFLCSDCSFDGAAEFAFMFFRRDARFAGTRFDGDTMLQKLRFRGAASFSNVGFSSEFSPREVRFGGAVAFHNSVFGGVADFTGCRFPRDARLHFAAFRGADFRRTADFTSAEFTPWGAFSGASFQQLVSFSPQALRGPAAFDATFRAADDAAAAAAKGDPAIYRRERDRRFGELAAAFQALKKAMAWRQARLDEHRFYRLELLAYRRCSSASVAERLIISAYDLSSRCGTSFVRPLVILAVLVLLFGFGFWLSTQTADGLAIALEPLPVRGPDAAFVDAVRFSLENTIQPMSVWKNVPASAHPRALWVQALLSEEDAIRFLLVRVVATLQSLVSIALLFLAALGFKRHFQMST